MREQEYLCDGSPIAEAPDQDLNVRGFEQIERGVRVLVSVLWKLGYKTVNSCAGHSEGSEPLPFVTISVYDCTPDMILELFLAVAGFNETRGQNGLLPRSRDTWVLSPQRVGGMTLLFLRPQSLNEGADFEEILRLRELGVHLANHLEAMLPMPRVPQ